MLRSMTRNILVKERLKTLVRYLKEADKKEFVGCAPF